MKDMKSFNILPGLILVTSIILPVTSCEKKPGLPILGTTIKITDITKISATARGYIIYDGGAPLKSAGICWDSIDNPTRDNNVIEADNRSGEIEVRLSMLWPGTTYYVRLFAENRTGIVYSKATKFSTRAILLPSVYTETVLNLKPGSAWLGVQAEGNGGGIIKKGVCWSTHPDPTITDNSTEINQG